MNNMMSDLEDRADALTALLFNHHPLKPPPLVLTPNPLIPTPLTPTLLTPNT